MKPSEFKIFISVESYYEKPAENYRNSYVVEKRIASKLSKTSIPNILIAQIEDINEDCVTISGLSLLCIPRNNQPKSVTVGSSWAGRAG